ncbi:hypothetical protein Tco_1357348 [Tanacetum coccineum]
MKSKRTIKPTKIFDNSVTSTSRNSIKQKNASKKGSDENVNVNGTVDCASESEGVKKKLKKVGGVNKSVDAGESSTNGSEKGVCETSKENKEHTIYNNNNDTSMKLDFEHTMVEDGNEFMIFDEELVNNGSGKWKLTICGHCIRMRMPYYELKYNLMESKGINKLASSIGKPLIMDEITANMCQFGRGRIGFAIVLIEVDAKKPFKDGIDM